MSSQDENGPFARKKLRVGHRSERAGVNAVRSLLEKHNLVVDEVDGRADYGRDLNVDLTEESEVTGGIIGVQVKSGPEKYFRHGQWIVPAKPKDWVYWRSSTVPIIGMVYDPARDVIRWTNLTQVARSKVVDVEDTYHPAAQSDQTTEVVAIEVLNDDSFDDFTQRTRTYLAATADSAFLLLTDAEPEVQRRGVFNCWTLGRRDPRPLILLRRMLPSLGDASLRDGISVLAHATPHPDIFWTKQNWIAPIVEADVQASFRWSPDELATLVRRLESMDDAGAEWARGGLGQSLWSIMVIDPGLRDKLPAAIRTCVEVGDTRAALRLLICLQYLADDAVQTVEEIIATYPPLAHDEMSAFLLEEVREHGWVDVY